MDEEKLTKAQIKEQRKQERQAYENQFKKAETKNKFKKIGFWIGGIVVVLLSLWGLIALVSAPSPSAQDLSLTAPKITNTDLSFGPNNAKATLIEYADFQCPSCKAQHESVDQLQKDYQGKIRFVYRFFPLQQIHQNANLSATAGYAAYLQGKFLEMSDLLFNSQETWATLPADKAEETFVAMAKSLNLDTDKFKTDMQLDSTKKFIQDEMDAGVGAGVNGTPTFFMNGKSFPIQSSYDGYKTIVENALK